MEEDEYINELKDLVLEIEKRIEKAKAKHQYIKSAHYRDLKKMINEQIIKIMAKSQLTNIQNAELELEHIKLELQNGRTQHLRHFIDQYFCYANGYVNKNGKAKWGAILWKEFVSIKASKLTNKKLVTKEHIIPLKVITQKLIDLGKNCTTQEIKTILDKYVLFGTITKEENELLNKAGLKQKMPKEFYDKTSPLFDDVMARYKIAEIK